MSIKCSHPDCTRRLTGKLDTYGPRDFPLCREHRWYEFDQAKAAVAAEVDARAADARQAAMWQGESADA